MILAVTSNTVAGDALWVNQQRGADDNPGTKQKPLARWLPGAIRALPDRSEHLSRGVELYNGDYEMIDCVIRGNSGKALLVNRGASVTLRNSVLAGPGELRTKGVKVAAGCSLEMRKCTLRGFHRALHAKVVRGEHVSWRGCNFLCCSENVRVTYRQANDKKPAPLDRLLTASGNRYEPAPFIVQRLVQSQDGSWQCQQDTFKPSEHAGFADAIGSDNDAIVQSVSGSDDAD